MANLVVSREKMEKEEKFSLINLMVLRQQIDTVNQKLIIDTDVCLMNLISGM